MADIPEKAETVEVVVDGKECSVDDPARGRVRVGPWGLHAREGQEDVKVGFTGIYIRDGQTRVSINLWKPFLGCALFVLLFVAAITAVIVGVVKWLMR
jgi:hypothetical protein